MYIINGVGDDDNNNTNRIRLTRFPPGRYCVVAIFELQIFQGLLVQKFFRVLTPEIAYTVRVSPCIGSNNVYSIANRRSRLSTYLIGSFVFSFLFKYIVYIKYIFISDSSQPSKRFLLKIRVMHRVA